MKVYGYARVSTADQNAAGQLDQITKYCGIRNLELMNIFEDQASGKDIDRPAFQRMLKDLEMNPLGIDAVVVYKLDRMGRSLSNLIELIGWFKKRGIGLIFIADSIDTTTPQGRLFFHVSGAFAEYEREIIVERTKMGLERAKAAGVILGPPKKYIDMGEVERLRAEGVPMTKIAKKFGVHRDTLYKRIKEGGTP